MNRSQLSADSRRRRLILHEPMQSCACMEKGETCGCYGPEPTVVIAVFTSEGLMREQSGVFASASMLEEMVSPYGAVAQKAIAAAWAAKDLPDRSVVVKGRGQIELYRELLVELARVSDQAGCADDVAYLLSTPNATKKIPYLVLERAIDGAPSVQGFSGATLLFEYGKLFFGSRIFTTPYGTGRRNVIAPPEVRTIVAARAARELIDRHGAHLVHVAFQQSTASFPQPTIAQEHFGHSFGKKKKGARTGTFLWSVSEKEAELFLRLEPTLEDTLARMGQKHRSNLRYYRRKAERELGCVFVPEATIDLPEFLKHSELSMFPTTEAVARWRFDSLKLVAHPILCGIRDRDGRWLSLVGGRRSGDHVEIDWLLNLEELKKYAISTVVRSFLIEHEIKRGSKRLYIENGSGHATTRSFVKEGIVKITAKRKSLYISLLSRIATRLLPERNPVRKRLVNPKTTWYSANLPG